MRTWEHSWILEWVPGVKGLLAWEFELGEKKKIICNMLELRHCVVVLIGGGLLSQMVEGYAVTCNDINFPFPYRVYQLSGGHVLLFPLLLLITNIPLPLKCFTVFKGKWRNKLQSYSGANSSLAGVCSSSGLWSVLERRTGRQRSLSYATNDKRIRKGCLHFFIFIWIFLYL